MSVRIIRIGNFVMTVTVETPNNFDTQKRAEELEEEFFENTAEELRREYKAEAVLRQGARFPTNSNRYRDHEYDTRTHRFEEPHKVGRRRETIRLVPAPHPISFEDFLEELGPESVIW